MEKEGEREEIVLATWQASGKLFILQQRLQLNANYGHNRKCRSLSGVGVRKGEGQSVKEINGLKIGKVNMSCALCPGTGCWLPLPGTNLFYFSTRMARTWPGQRTARGLSANSKMRFLSSAFLLLNFPPSSLHSALHSFPLSISLRAAISFGGHKSVTALKMTDTACWSHGQEREASRCYKVDKPTHTHQIHTQPFDSHEQLPHHLQFIEFS